MNAPREGLTQAEAVRRLARDGPNELPRQDRRTLLRIVGEVLREPMLLLLLAGGVIYLALGDLTEAIVLIVFATFSVVITVVQETRTERVLETLRDLTSPRALVLRDGERKRIAGREVVEGDVVILSEGDRTPADGVVLRSSDLAADESLLTGESAPVRKIASLDAPTAAPRPGGDDLPFVFSGSLIVRGSGVARITATGPRSEIGRIGQTLATLEVAPPRLQMQTRRLVLIFALLGGAVSGVAVLLYGLLRGGWLDALLAGVALGMAMLPEEFPVVLTVFMAMGAWRISRARVLTRRAASIEALGAATVLCSDKTGTLTQNRMRVGALATMDGALVRMSGVGATALKPPFCELARHAALASAPEPSDPMEAAIQAFAHGTSKPADGALSLERAYGLGPDLLAVSNLWRTRNEDAIVAAKGAPEAIATLCRLGDGERERMRAGADELARDGMRVLGVARATFHGERPPDAQTGFDFTFLGLVGLVDPLREGAREAVEECARAGVRVIMITGDYPQTALAIAREAGIQSQAAVGGDQLAQMTDAELTQAVRTVNVFARIMPEQKLRIVQALKSDGEVVAMTGDGVNDAPSLKAADIGVAMGGRGADVAREAASIVLLDDNFASIVGSIRLGRRIYDNLRKAMAFILAVHVPVAGIAIIPLALGLPVMLGPIHIAFLEMIIDPVCSLAFEAETEEKDVMQRPPRDPDETLLSPALIAWGLAQGALAFAFVAAVFLLALEHGAATESARAVTFLALVMTILALIFANRSFSPSLGEALTRPNRALAVVMIAVPSILAAVLAWPPASALFRFGPIEAPAAAMTVGGGLALIVLLEWIKRLARRPRPRSL
ncbi:MAG: cation-translocating P-type ATPase [Beijerinckiaceae bacterium]